MVISVQPRWIILCSDIKITGSSHVVYSNATCKTSNVSKPLWEVQEKFRAARDFCPRPRIFLLLRTPALWAGLTQLWCFSGYHRQSKLEAAVRWTKIPDCASQQAVGSGVTHPKEAAHSSMQSGLTLAKAWRLLVMESCNSNKGFLSLNGHTIVGVK